MNSKETKPQVPISKALVANGFLFISGQLGTSGGVLVNTSFADEVRQVLINIENILAEHQLTFGHVVSITIYLTDMRWFDELNLVYATYFKDRFPTRTCIAVAALPKLARVEMTTVASLVLE
ncbi:RidA family protein [Dyadobacter sp. CY345]|uniref:Rid family hydrolase n=1 Tax=Dyadobacter sp. CY345 TaxID=2909335 RepID=UPI001F190861|nr:Rid family hydrolase [Dyadobacter sp. CY345]MCF2444819.1 RidA family protein [Dyadobacter sp. CY345]